MFVVLVVSCCGCLTTNVPGLCEVAEIEDEAFDLDDT
jgi:hypothetical protein